MFTNQVKYSIILLEVINMYKAKVKWNGDHYSAGFEVKGSKIEKREYGRLLGFSTTSRFRNSHSTETEEMSVSRLMRALSSECKVKKYEI